MAGLDRPNHVAIVREPFARLFSLDVGAGDDLILGNDAMLLAIPMLEDEDTTSGIAVVAGALPLHAFVHLCKLYISPQALAV